MGGFDHFDESELESIKFRANRNTLGTVTVSEDWKNLFQPDGLTLCYIRLLACTAYMYSLCADGTHIDDPTQPLADIYEACSTAHGKSKSGLTTAATAAATAATAAMHIL